MIMTIISIIALWLVFLELRNVRKTRTLKQILLGYKSNFGDTVVGLDISGLPLHW